MPTLLHAIVVAWLIRTLHTWARRRRGLVASSETKIDISFAKKEKAAHWDLRVEDAHGNAITWENLNLKEISEVALHYKDGKAWADVK